ncbi:deacetylase complex subunit Sds3 [Purpureocillium lilacinum]|uniref:Deacetylase complex subunit Sds3 n=1 Tax=Purpureocillium lilacinum TaxID=33203 RepID=A0A179GPZ4_PURLI|nr:deacetylase complex subunit Sds3 [Purpureocillium lilacinum]KAK4087254.1 hypothetical protein Purlil1_8329 [Purpureocillium lilacinum]OAQ80006.1 deacetylase complex subunit Sds3 [Purpureocillium lilacinum]OAQ88589.1 deacetylase complex subunit Sds3 [Purpureocillium lilacinum]PWI73857.1 deacetylase complex subunit Sds3 [Purpureocillium lilacinum]GJN74264.1 hypothetical protein PLICBS_008355 [Purpureocillium lilacinum]
MAASEAAVSSALGAKAERRSPPPTTQSKRDRKRQAVLERLAALNDKFQDDKDSTYRDQLQKIQFEINHMQKFDPYADDALDVASRLQDEYNQTMGTPMHAESARSLMDMAGVQLPQFMSDIQDLWEIRDFSLTQAKNEYERKVQEFQNTFTFKMETAKREHEALNSTMRDRLINQLTNKKNRLVKEKEAFEISETNALLLHPSQFSLANPGSPGGHPGKRTTRNRKEADDFSEGKKRKRNGGEDDGSPAPSRRALDPNNTTPFWQSEKMRNEAKKRGADYSIGSLFTDKELSMHYNTAALAAHKSMVRHRVTGSDSSPEDSDSGDGEQASSAAMERQVSHQTRSTRGNANQNFVDDKLLGIEGVANYELPANLDLMHSQVDPKIPVGQPSYYLKTSLKASSENSAIPQTRDDDFKADMQVITALKHYDHTRKPGSHLDNPKGPRKTFETVSTPYKSGKYMGFAALARDPAELENYAEVLEDAAPATSSLRETLQPASRQSSVGGVAMSRQGTAGSGRGKPRRY